MKKSVKISLIVFGILLGISIIFIGIDTLQAKIFNRSPLIHKREYINRCNKNDYVDKGILVKHYRCANKEETIFINADFECVVCY